jgi:predicted N-acetyltransferase YhbS
MGERLIVLLGSPSYYGRFGFEPSTLHGIAPPDPAWGDDFQVKLLSGPQSPIKGTFRYAPPFGIPAT